MPTIRYARAHLRIARNTLVRCDPYLADRDTWTQYIGPVPGRRTAHATRARIGTGR